MFDLGDKSAVKSLTMAGAAVFAALQTLEGMGAIPAGVAANVAAVAKGLAFLATAFGARRAIGRNGFLAPLEEAETFEVEEDFEDEGYDPCGDLEQ